MHKVLKTEEREGLTVEWLMEPEDLDIAESFDARDHDIAKLREQVASGAMQWFCLRVDVKDEDDTVLASNFLGGCMHEPGKESEAIDAYPDLADDAIIEAKAKIRKLARIVRPAPKTEYGIDQKFSPGGRASLEHYDPTWHPTPIALVPNTAHGDYVGAGTVGASNCRVLKERARELGLMTIVGSHGYEAIAYDPTWVCNELQEIIDGLEKYPLLDEEDHSAYEAECVEKHLADYGGKDAWQSALKKCAILLDLDDHETLCPDEERERLTLTEYRALCDLLTGGEELIDTSTPEGYLHDFRDKIRAENLDEVLEILGLQKP